MVHGHFISMGGFIYEDEDSHLYPITVESLFSKLERDDYNDIIDLGEPKCLPTGAVLITYNRPLSESTFKVKNGEVDIDVETPAGDGASESESSLRIIDIIADIPESEITGRSAGDGLSKLIAMLQVLWFIAQCIERLRLHLSITELEVMTAAFATLNVMVYIFWWYKPLGVDQQILLYSRDITFKEAPSPTFSNSSSEGLKCDLEPEEVRETEVAESASMVQYMVESLFGTYDLQDASLLKRSDGRVGMLWSGLLYDVQGTSLLSCILIIGCIFGAIHIAAWNLQFVTVGERWVRRVSAVAITSAPGLPLFAGVFGGLTMVTWALSVTAFYIISRFTLLILPLLQLRSLPSDAFISVSWSTLIPHI
jgi:hypothetical protein